MEPISARYGNGAAKQRLGDRFPKTLVVRV
jgi:hypothetical protein